MLDWRILEDNYLYFRLTEVEAEVARLFVYFASPASEPIAQAACIEASTVRSILWRIRLKTRCGNNPVALYRTLTTPHGYALFEEAA